MSVSEIVERYERSWADRDPQEMVTCFAAAGTYNSPGADYLRGDAIAEFARAFFTAFPDSKYEWTMSVLGDDTAAVEWTFSGTMTGPLLGISPTGEGASARGAHIVRVAGDRLATVESFWDNQSFFAQLGIKA